MSEIIAKSKMHKIERQKQKDLDDDLRDELDQDLDGLRELLEAAPPKDRSAPSALPQQPRTAPDAGGAEADSNYDQYVRTLAYEARAKPKDRTKTEEEVAKEEAEKLQKAEAKRQRRMAGEDVSDEEDEEEGGYRKRRRVDRRGEADDLDDDFVEDEELLGPGITREALEKMARPQGSDEEDGDEDDEEGSEDDDEEDGSDNEDDEDDDAEDEDEEDEMSAMEDLNDDVDEDSDASEGEDLVKRKSSKKGKAKVAPVKEIPFTFPCPTSIEEFEDILEDLDDSALATVVQRIRAVHHPSLAEGNKEKLQEFLGVLLDYILILASRPTPSFDLISSLTPHVVALVKLNAITAATHFISKITLMQKNLSRGLARGATNFSSRTYPGAPELVLLRFVGLIWSTSDYSHPVVIPAVLLMGQYLSQGRVRSLKDIASGLFLCSILAGYEAFSKRLVPEAVNFIASTLTILLPRRKEFKAVGSAYPDIKAPGSDISLPSSSTAAPSEPVDLARALSSPNSSEEAVKADLVAVGLRLSQTYAGMYASHEAFIEVITPVKAVIEGSRLPKQAAALKVRSPAIPTSSPPIMQIEQALTFRRSNHPPSPPSQECYPSPRLAHHSPSKRTSLSQSNPSHQSSKKTSRQESTTTPTSSGTQRRSSRRCTRRSAREQSGNSGRTIGSWRARRLASSGRRTLLILPRCAESRERSTSSERKRRRCRGELGVDVSASLKLTSGRRSARSAEPEGDEFAMSVLVCRLNFISTLTHMYMHMQCIQYHRE